MEKLYPLYHDPSILVDKYGRVRKVKKKTKKQKKTKKHLKKEARRAVEEWWARRLYAHFLKVTKN